MPHSATALSLLVETLEFVKQQGTLVAEVSDDWVNEHKLQGLVVPLGTEPKGDKTLSAANQKLFSLIDIGTHDLQRLWASDSKYAVRSLGYAFHIIPPLLRTPERFSPQSYLFCFRIVCNHWNELSPEMRQAFCAIQGLELAEATRLVNSAEFPIQMWRTRSEE
jgi:hypothetical protein